MKKKISKTKHKKGTWFYSVRGSYLPCSWQGWALYIPFTIFLITVLVAAVRSEHSVSDMLYLTFPQGVAAAVVMTWIAKQKS